MLRNAQARTRRRELLLKTVAAPVLVCALAVSCGAVVWADSLDAVVESLPADGFSARHGDQLSRSDLRSMMEAGPESSALARLNQLSADATDIFLAERSSFLSAQAAEIGGAQAVLNEAERQREAARRAALAAAASQIAASATGMRATAREMMLSRYGWGDDEFVCFDSIIMRESSWRVNATNPTSGAYGLPQALPAAKMASAGDDWLTNPVTQISWALDYIKGRYGTPCQAWAFWQAHNWY